MYTEEPKRNINWSQIIKKGILIIGVLLIIIFIIWLLTQNKDKNKVEFNNSTENNGTITNKDAYSNEFITGYTYFHDTAKDYLLVNSTLPTNGNSLKYTLKDLTDKGVILPFTYKNGETCDLEASYVIVKNNNGKYEMSVTLVCGTEVAKTTEELGCNQLCAGNGCSVEVKPNEPSNDDEYVIEYQYKQGYYDTETTYSCPNGYTKNGTICVKNTESTVKAIKKTTYACPSGYEKIGFGSTTVCVKENNKQIAPQVVTSYTCEKGYTKVGEGENTTCTKTIDANKTTNYTCPSGYSQTGSGANTKCIKTNPSTTVAPTYTCPSGYSQTGSGANTKCVKSEPKTVTGYTTYCSQGTPVGSKCRVYVGERYLTYYESHGPSVGGCTLSGKSTAGCKNGVCSQTIYTYYCKAYSYDIAASQKAVYGCKSGSPSGDSCVTTINATPSCSKGTLNSNKTACVIDGAKEEVKPTVTYKYTCSEGKLNGTKCVVTDNNKVVKETTTTCPSGYSKNGNVCVAKGTDYKDYTIKTEYFCKSGYTKYGEGANTVCTKGSSSQVNATKETKKVTKYRYKWSTETYLEGWEKTGKTRQTKISSK